MKNFKRILGLVTVLVAVGILSMVAFAEVNDITADLEEPVSVAEADVVEVETEVDVTEEDAFVCTGECTGECEGEGPIQARDGSGSGMQKRLGGGEGNANGEGKGLRNGEGLCNGEGVGEGSGNGSGYRGGRNS